MSTAPHTRHRLAGLALAALGVGVARIAPADAADAGSRAVFTLVGVGLAATGLLLIALGVRRRLQSQSDDTGAPRP